MLSHFSSGGTIAGTIGDAPPAPAPSGPPRPPGIPEHYVFDDEVELWMPPSAISKAAAVAPATGANLPPGVTVIKSGDANQAPYDTGNSNDPICFEFTNTGQCSRLIKGQICRYRHLPANHPDVIADKVRQGKLPPSALVTPGCGQAPAPSADPSMPPDPGPGAALCFDFINGGSCSRLASGAGCKYRHLPPNHPDVIADKIRQGKLNPAMAAQLLSSGSGGAAVQSLGQPNQPPVLPPPPVVAPTPMAMSMAADPSQAAAMAALLPDPGPGMQLCFDFVNKGICSRIARGDICRYRHLPPNHPDVVADKIRQGKAPGVMPTTPMANFTEHLAMSGMMQGLTGHPGALHSACNVMCANAAASLPKEAPPRRGGDDDDDLGERFRERDRQRREQSDRGYRDDDRYDRRSRHDDYDRRDYDRRDHRDRRYDRRDYDRRDYRDRDYDRRDRDRRDRYDDRRYDDRRRDDDRRREDDRRRRDDEDAPRDGDEGRPAGEEPEAKSEE